MALTPAEFWSFVAVAVHDCRAATPELADAFGQYDIFAPAFALSCLNRLQLRNHQQMVDLTDVAGPAVRRHSGQPSVDNSCGGSAKSVKLLG